MRNPEELLTQALQLPQHDRAKMAARLLESLDEQPEIEVEQEWAEEIERRCAAVDAGEAITSDWETFRQRVEREVFGR